MIKPVNKTFLGIDSILYPSTTNKVPDHVEKLDKKSRRKTIKQDNFAETLTGLKNYPAAGKQVYKLMNEERTKQIQHAIYDTMHPQERSASPMLSE